MKLESLPHSIGNLEALETLNLRYCRSLKSLPKSIRRLKSLKEIHLRQCNSLDMNTVRPLFRIKSLRQLSLVGGTRWSKEEDSEEEDSDEEEDSEEDSIEEKFT